jgi:hypothetical protein
VIPPPSDATRVGDVLDRNVCACGTAVLLVVGVGWVHAVFAPADALLGPQFRACDNAAPAWLRCPSCRQLAKHWGSRMRPHRTRHGGSCSGSRERGVAPLGERAAFPAAPT